MPPSRRNANNRSMAYERCLLLRDVVRNFGCKLMPEDRSTTQAMLALLKILGLVKCDLHPSDSEAHMVALTAAGKLRYR